MIYFFEEMDKMTVEDIDKLEWCFPWNDNETNYIFRNKKERVLAYALFMLGIKEEFNICEKVHLVKNNYGKPMIQNGMFEFNISHTETGVACAIDNEPIGVDIQQWIDYTNGLEKYVFSIVEKQKFYIYENKKYMFTRIWAIKESYGKFLGIGNGFGMTEKSFLDFDKTFFKYDDLFFRVLDTPNNVLSICSKKPMELIKLNKNQILDIVGSRNHYFK